MSLLILLYHLLLIQTLYSHYSASFLLFAESYFAEGSSSDDSDELKALFADLLSPFSEFLHLLLQNIVFGLFSFFKCKVKLSNFLLENFPNFVALLLAKFVKIIFFLDIAFGLLSFEFGSLTYHYFCFHILSVKIYQ